MSMIPATCMCCMKPLTGDEEYWYQFRCEECELENHERIQAWRKGADDPELDTQYSGPPVAKH